MGGGVVLRVLPNILAPLGKHLPHSSALAKDESEGEAASQSPSPGCLGYLESLISSSRAEMLTMKLPVEAQRMSSATR